jgi:hypothetical protein
MSPLLKARLYGAKGVFSSPPIPKKFGFWFIILQNGTKHYAKFLAKRWLFSILDFGLKRPKNPKEPHEALMRAINSTALFTSPNILQNVSDSPSHRILRHMYRILNID